MTARKKRIPATSSTFTSDVKTVTNSLRKAFNDVLLALGADPLDMRSIAERAGVSQTLAWKLSKIVSAEDPAVVLKRMPRRAGLEIFLDAAARAGAKPRVLAAARSAVVEYQQLIQTHSGDRDTLDILGGSISPHARRDQDEQHRKLLFQGASYIWGVQARVILKIGIIGPGATADVLDFASLGAIVDFRRLRPDVSWLMASRQMAKDDGTHLAGILEEALDPRHDDPRKPPLVEAFCSQPLPQLRRVPQGNPDLHVFELVEGPIGNSGALTCVVGTISRSLPAFASPDNQWAGHIVTSDTPTDCLIIEQFIHLSSLGKVPLEVSMHAQLRVATPQFGPQTQLALTEPLQDLGVNAPFIPISEVMQRDQMVEWMFQRMGWNPAEFRAFRIRIPYPICPSAFVIKYPLPTR